MGGEGNNMADIARVTINWTGFIGAPGYTNLYFRNATPGIIDQAVVDNAVTKVDNWISGFQTRIPTTVTCQTDPTVEVIDDTNGQLQEFMNATVGAPRVGTGTGNYSAAAGAVCNWYTGGIRNGRRIRGRSFLVPLAGSALGPNGTLDDANLTALRTNTTTFTAATGAARLVVWGRPSTPGGTDGVSAEVISFTIPDKTAVLTSRRD
jgi:hypothetical protein